MPQITIYPDADPEVTSVDGWVVHESANDTWANIRGGAGTDASSGAPTYAGASVLAGATTDKWSEMYRSIYLFDTSVIPADATITSATYSLYVYNKINGLSLSDAHGGICLVSSAPTSNTALASGDYNNLGTTEFATRIGYSSITVDGYNDMALNASGLAAIDKSGITKFGVRMGADLDNSEPAWVITRESRFLACFSESSGTSKNPKLVINYTLPDPPTKTTEVGTGSTRPTYTIKVWKYEWDDTFGDGGAPYNFNEANPIRNLVAEWDDATFIGFEKTINGGCGECIFTLGRKFDDFGEGEDVALYNMVEIISNDRYGSKVIYTGYISKYKPMVDGNTEKVEVTCLGYQTTLKFQTYHFNHGDLSSTIQEHLLYKISNINPANIIKYMVDGHIFATDKELEPVDAFSPINYTATSIENSATVSMKVSYPTKYEMLDWCVEVSENIDYWYMDGEATIHYKAFSNEEDHDFTFGKDFKNVNLEKSIENTFNKTVMSNRRQWGDKDYAALHFPVGNHTQLGSYQLEEGYVREELVEDQTIETQDELLTKGTKRNEAVSDPNRTIDFNISGDIYDIDSINPGDTCRIQNMPETIDIDLNKMAIRKVTYMKDYVKLQVITQKEQLKSQITDRDPTRTLKIVGREDIPNKLYYDITA